MGGCGALRRCGCARTYEGTQFLCVKFRLGSAGEPTICSHCYSVAYMKIPANNQVLFMQITFSNAFSLMKIDEFQLKFHWNFLLRVKLTIVQHQFRLWLGTGQVTSHCLNQWWLDCWCIYMRHSARMSETSFSKVVVPLLIFIQCWALDKFERKILTCFKILHKIRWL